MGFENMNKLTTLEIIAPTVEEALAQGLEQLGLTADAVSIEVLDSGNKGLFGLGGRQVRVRLMVNPPGGMPLPPSAPEPRAAAVEKNPRAPKSTRAESKRKPVERAPRTEHAGSAPASVVRSGDEHDTVLDTSESIVSKLLFMMGYEAQVSAHYGEEHDDRRPIMVDVRGTDLSAVIGHRGETLDAFQYISSLIIGKETGQFVHVVMDVEGHRSKREEQLRQLARRMADQVTKSGRKLSLEPMRAAERRIIHLELRDHPAVTTESVGMDPHRKVSIIPKE